MAKTQIDNTQVNPVDNYTVGKLTTGFDNIASSWATTGSLNVARRAASLVLLPNGKALQFGGEPDNSGSTSTNSVEIYDPSTALWTVAASMGSARCWPTSDGCGTSPHAVILKTGTQAGNVFVVGGNTAGNGGATGSSEYYNISGNSWSAGPSIPSNSSNVRLVLMNDTNRRVLGVSGTQPKVFDPTTLSWGSTSGFNTYSGQLQNGGEIVLLNDGTVLYCGGTGFSFSSPKQGQIFTPGPDSWALTTGTQNYQRSDHTATLLSDGRVLITGGRNAIGGATLNTAEVYNPATGLFTPTSSTMTQARQNHSATLLPNGKVLIFGGVNNNSAEVFDPVTNTFSAEPSAANNGWSRAMVLLNTNKVLAATGTNPGGGVDTYAELYTPEILNGVSLLDETSKTVSLTAPKTLTSSYSLSLPTSLPTSSLPLALGTNGSISATTLSFGTQVVPGGYGTFAYPGNFSANTLTANGAALNTWPASLVANVNVPRERMTITQLQNGKILMAGGLATGNVRLASCELYDPATNTWTFTGSLPSPVDGHKAVLLPNGKVLVVNGIGGTFGNPTNTCYLYDPTAGTWSTTGSTAQSRPADVRYLQHTVTLLADNLHVLVTGGTNPSGTYPVSNAPASELYDINAGTWSNTGTMTHNRGTHKATLLNNGTVLVTGGVAGTSPSQRLIPYNDAETYDPGTGLWTACANTMQNGREDHAQCMLPNGHVLVAGGQDGFNDSNFNSVDNYNPTTRTFTPAASMIDARAQADMILLSTTDDPRYHYVFISCGGLYGNGQILTTSELYIVEKDVWIQSGLVNDPTGHGNYDHLVQLSSGLVFIACGGGFNQNNYQSPISELFVPPIVSLNTTGNEMLKGIFLFEDLNSSNVIALSVPALAASYQLTLPNAQGAALTFLQNDGSGNTSWVAVPPTNPGGANTDVQFNNSGTFGGSANLTWNDGTTTLGIGPNGSIQGGSGFIQINQTIDTSSGHGIYFGTPNGGGNTLLTDAGPGTGPQLYINANNPMPDPSAMLQMDSTKMGFLAPRMTTAQRNAIASPATGLQIYNTDDNQPEVYNGTTWVPMGGTTTFVDDVFTAVSSGTGQTFTLSQAPINASEVISHNGLVLRPTIDYTISGTTLTILENVNIGDSIQATYAATVGGIAVTPGGSDKDIQFNSGGSFGGSADFTFDITSDTLSITPPNASGNSPTIILQDNNNNGAAIYAYSDNSAQIVAFNANGSVDVGGLAFQPTVPSAAVQLACNMAGGSVEIVTPGFGWFFDSTGTLTLASGGALVTSGSIAANIITTTSVTYNVNVQDYTVRGNATSNNIAINLPAANAVVGRLLNFKKVDATANTVTINRAGSDLIDGQISVPLTAQYQSVTIQSDGTNWNIL